MSERRRRVLVLGLGDTGWSMARHLARDAARLRVADTRASPPRLAELRASLPHAEVHCGPFGAALFEDIDGIAISPGVPRTDPELARALARGVPVIGDIELFARATGDRGRVVAITGTNGKSTVTALTGAMCRAAGLDCEVAGNIGPPVLDALAAREAAGRLPAAWVLELSSFQLESTYSLRPAAAAMLNVSEDHADRYASIDDYVSAKARVFAGDGVQVLNRDDPHSRAMALAGRQVLSFGLGRPRDEREFGLIERDGRTWLARGAHALLEAAALRIAGRHNAANALAALALGHALGLPEHPMLDALREFRGLRHRVEWIAEIGGVACYDDSKGTNVGATVAALDGLGGRGRVVLIAGGEGKGQDFAPLVPALARAGRAAVLIGRDAARIEQAIAGAGVPLQRAADLREAVHRGLAFARPGDALLLSPACASFDMFRDYAHRGEEFRRAVGEEADARAH